MKKYNVFMYDIPLAPLTYDTKYRPAETRHFDEENEAVEFAKSERNNWERVTIHQTSDNKQIISFYGNDMYIDSKRTRLKEDE